MVVIYNAKNLKKLLFVLSVFDWRVKCAELKTLIAKNAGTSSVPVNTHNAPSVSNLKKKNKNYQRLTLNLKHKLSLGGPFTQTQLN